MDRGRRGRRTAVLQSAPCCTIILMTSTPPSSFATRAARCSGVHELGTSCTLPSSWPGIVTCGSVLAAGGGGAGAGAGGGGGVLPQLSLCCFQWRFWQAVLQYHTCLQREQRSSLPGAAPQAAQTSLGASGTATGSGSCCASGSGSGAGPGSGSGTGAGTGAGASPASESESETLVGMARAAAGSAPAERQSRAAAWSPAPSACHRRVVASEWAIAPTGPEGVGIARPARRP